MRGRSAGSSHLGSGSRGIQCFLISLLSAVGVYRPLVDFAGAGASVPLIGFGHVLWEGMKKAIEEDGILGLFTGGFTACAAGVSSALIFSYLASLFFRPKMKK